MASKRNLFEEIRAGLEAYRAHPRSLIERGVSHREKASQRVPRSMDSAVCDLAKGTPLGRAAAYSTGCPRACALPRTRSSRVTTVINCGGSPISPAVAR
jgi:hypothetical protein